MLANPACADGHTAELAGIAPETSRRRLDADMVRIFVGGIPGADTGVEENLMISRG
jgi:hypothetical protein